MKILAVDDEKLALNGMVKALEVACPNGEVFPFQNSLEALEFARSTPCDVAFLDIEMREMNGLSMALKLKEIYPEINIIFATGYSQYAIDALNLHASGYVLKPATPESVANELACLRCPVKPATDKLIRVQTFGNFQVFSGSQVVRFARTKTLELLAYLVDRRGAAVNTEELCAVLWEEETQDNVSVKATLRVLIADLSKTLESVGASKVFIKSRNSFAIDPKEIDCDYYRLLNNDVAAINSYMGEYMSQYSWAELTLGGLESKRL